MIDARASYLDIAHASIAGHWLKEKQRAIISRFDPSGVIRDLALTVRDIDTDFPLFDVKVAFENLGIAEEGDRPGVRGLSGSLSADHSGGLLELDSTALTVTAARALARPLTLDEARGTVIWRRAKDRMTVLSDSIILRNAFFNSDTSVELSITEDGNAPVIDAEMRFDVGDAAQAASFVPFMEKRPKISQWFQSGLEVGRITDGRAYLNGPIDKLPFDKGDGLMLVNATFRDGVVKFLPRWPAANVTEADIVLENLSLRSHRNRIELVGNKTVDAKIEVSHFRIDPMMTLSAISNGTVESLLDLALQSPINEMLGGQLDRVTASGDATTTIDLDVPIRDSKNFTLACR